MSVATSRRATRGAPSNGEVPRARFPVRAPAPVVHHASVRNNERKIPHHADNLRARTPGARSANAQVARWKRGETETSTKRREERRAPGRVVPHDKGTKRGARTLSKPESYVACSSWPKTFVRWSTDGSVELEQLVEFVKRRPAKKGTHDPAKRGFVVAR